MSPFDEIIDLLIVFLNHVNHFIAFNGNHYNFGIKLTFEPLHEKKKQRFLIC